MNPDSKELEVLGRTDATSPVIFGHDVYDALTYAPRVVRFSRKQYQFLNHYRLGISLAEAAEKAALTSEQAIRFLEREDVKAWLEDRALMTHIKESWEEPAKWWKEGNDVWEGKKQANKGQMLVWQEFGQRICPKKLADGASGTKIEINIDPKAVRDAFVRQDAIEAKLAQEGELVP